MSLCTFAGGKCSVCGAPKVNARQVCGSWAKRRAQGPPRPAGGPGTELKRLLAGWPFFMEATAECSCAATADQMDAWGDECSKPERMAWILGRLRDEAQARRLPFVEAGARLVVRRAIVRARRAARALPAAGQG